MTLKLTSVIFLFLILHAPLALGQKCKGYLPKGPGRGGSAQASSGKGPTIKTKPQPEYTREAERHQALGRVVLCVVLHSNGKVRDDCVVKGLPYGLTKSAVDAAHRIRFEPAEEDGRPVSVTTLIEYEFSTY
jgi:TonB family protein